MSMDIRFSPGARSGAEFLFLGNEALVRGCLECGVAFIAQYPGTPTSDIGETFQKVLSEQPELKEFIIHQWSTNEAIATSSCAGAAWAGFRALNPMKHVGLNVASDPMSVITLNGPNPGALVFVVGSDPGSLGSHQEQNDRFYSWMFHTPMIEPHTPQECHDWIKLAFDISEKYDIPVFFRTSTRSAHSRGKVIVGDFKLPSRRIGTFERNTGKYCSLPPYAIDNHVRLYERVERLMDDIPTFGLNRVYPGDSTKFGVITYGIPFGYTIEALHQLGLDDVPVLKLGMTHPLNEGEVINFIKDLDEIVIVEELEPFLEVKIREIAQKNRINSKIVGSEIFPKYNEFNTGLVASCLAKFTGSLLDSRIQRAQQIFRKIKPQIPSRFPTFCPGCPERAMLMEIKKATNNLENPKTVIAGDIGCYVMGIMPPLKISDFIICMSGGLSAAIGLSKKIDDKIIALIGDSTLMHTGLPVLADAVANNANVLVIVFDNRWVAMTGHQPPSGKGKISFEKLCKSIGVTWLKVVDPFEVDKTVKIIRDGLAKDGVKVIICQRECALMSRRIFMRQKRELEFRDEKYRWKSFQVYNCVLCEKCSELLSCPAFRRTKDEFGNEMMKIDEDRCALCGVCAQICPHGRIKTTIIDPHVDIHLILRRLENES
ncbi:MAG: thiamine pyrophosphate-dependent enzyme [Promethearchaeota archaeon]